jgi:hypothetical protein
MYSKVQLENFTSISIETYLITAPPRLPMIIFRSISEIFKHVLTYQEMFSILY